ncbi:protein of unknown function (plasmid) [Azospirillum baldaniorum]|uniref:Uncharacterized protein n=1 Tax=Azospirillum baldaniorum TaxID=1064539 RepID=A0A9P1JUN3_9PROT|nr:protein of unknown function [Azospirillum baldaniorum]
MVEMSPRENSNTLATVTNGYELGTKLET